MPTLVQDETGAYFVDTGGNTYQPVTEEQARTFLAGQGAGAGAVQAAGQGLENLITGAGSLLSDNPYWLEANRAGQAQSEALNLANPVTSQLAQYAPQTGIGVATAGAGILPTAAVEAGLGAATTPEAPVQGALLGGVLGAAGAALPGAVTYGVQKGKQLGQKLPWFRPEDAADALATPGYTRPGDLPPPTTGEPAGVSTQPAAPAAASPSTNPPGRAPVQAPRMAERVQAAMAEADQVPAVGPRGDTRVQSGQLSPFELYEYGVPTTEGDKLLMRAMNGQGEYQKALQVLRQEEARRSNPLMAGNINQVRDAQQYAATQFLARELDFPPGVNLTDPALSEVVAGVGAGMDRIALEMGNVPIDDAIRADFTKIIEHSTGDAKSKMQALVNEVIEKADLNGGRLSGEGWGEMRTKILEVHERAMKRGDHGKMVDAGELLQTLTDAMESSLPDATRLELQKLRKQYAIAATLQKAGARNPDGQVNPVSFYNNWKRPQSKKAQGTDDVGRFMNTMVTLTSKRTPDSGTAPRLLQGIVDMGLDLVPGGQLAKKAIR